MITQLCGVVYFKRSTVKGGLSQLQEGQQAQRVAPGSGAKPEFEGPEVDPPQAWPRPFLYSMASQTCWPRPRAWPRMTSRS